MHSATSVVRAIRPGANRAVRRPTEEPRSLPEVRFLREKRISIYGEPGPGAAVTRFGDGGRPPLLPFDDGGPPLLPWYDGGPPSPPWYDGHRPPLLRFGDGGPPAKKPSLALQACVAVAPAESGAWRVGCAARLGIAQASMQKPAPDRTAFADAACVALPGAI
jgi:hypothetical protein